MRFVTKFWLCIGAVVVGYLATVVLDVGLALSNEARMATTSAALFPATIKCQEARHAFERQLKLYEDGVVQGEAALVRRASTSGQQVTDLLAEIVALPGLVTEDRVALSALEERHRTFTAAAATVYLGMADASAADEVRKRAAELNKESLRIQEELTARVDGLADHLRDGLDDAAQAMRHQRIAGISAFLVIVTCSLIGVALVMLGWSHRLRALLKASNQLAGGDYGAVLPARRNDELGNLTVSFASMRDAVQARAEELRTFNASLEDTVRARTSELAGKNASLSAEISERKRAEHALRLLEAAVNQINEAVIVSTPGAVPEEARIVHVNPAFARVTGWPADAVCDQALAVLIGPTTDRTAFAGLFATAAGGGDGAAEIICRRQDGSEYHGEWHISPIRAADGTVSNLVAIQRDITERKRVQGELEAANRQAGMAEIATGVLHNVGNVLNSVNVSAGLLVEHLNNPRLENLRRSALLLKEGAAVPDFLRLDSRGQKLPDYLDKLVGFIDQDRGVMKTELHNLVKAVDHIKAIISMQQAYAKAGNVLAPMRLVEICEDALRMNQANLERSEITVRREYEDLPVMRLDRHKILQILINLIANARQAVTEAAPAERLLSIGIGLAGPGRVRVWVADNGVGITPENLTRIFSHGFTTKASGHGFGLHRCANTASEMEGRLTASSDGPGRGARFELELPYQQRSGA